MKQFDHQNGGYLAIDDAQIYYEILENSSKPTLVMLHGGFGNIEDLNRIVQYLSDDFHIIGIDSRGHGKSTFGSLGLTYKILENDVATVLKRLGIERLNVLGFSDGGVVALRLASGGKYAIDKIIAIAASWSIDDVIESEEMLQTIDAQSAKEIFADAYDFYQKNNPEPNFDLFVSQIVQMWLDKTASGQPDANVCNIGAPTLLVRGDKDFLTSIDSLIKLQKNIENSALLNVPFCETAKNMIPFCLKMSFIMILFAYFKLNRYHIK